jgi:Domain of unknown function (DUF4169)
MGEVINLRRVRKSVVRRKAATHAAENRFMHGRSKSARTLQEKLDAKSRRALDQHKSETGEG